MPVSPPVPPRGRIPLGVHRRVVSGRGAPRTRRHLCTDRSAWRVGDVRGLARRPVRLAPLRRNPGRDERNSGRPAGVPQGSAAAHPRIAVPTHRHPVVAAMSCNQQIRRRAKRIQAVASGSPALHPLPHDSRTPNESVIRRRAGSSPGGLRVVIQALPDGDYRMARNASGNGRTSLKNTGAGSHKCVDPPAQKEMRPCPRQTEDGSSSRVSLDIRVSRVSGLLVGANSRVAATAAGARVAKQETNIVPGATARSSVALQSYAARKSALVQPCRPDSSSWSLDTRCRCLADSRKGSMCRSNSLICRHSPQAPFPRRKRRRSG